MKTTAAVLVRTGQPLELLELEIPALKPGQVLVEVAFSGLCHTQVLECRGLRGEDRFLPHCLGHEGSGRVHAAGPGVTKVKEGDQVILSWIKGSGADVPGTVYRWGDRDVNSGAVTTFGRHAVVSENRLTVLRAGIALRDAAMLGCALPTGLGAVFNVARPSSGQSLAVFGMGGIGLCALQAARIAGCKPLIAVDVNPEKLKLALSLGATDAVDASLEDAAARIASLAPRGLDLAVESSGRPSAMLAALSAVRSQGGAAVIVGNARHGEMLTIDPRQLNQGKRLLGTWGGDNQPDRDYPRYAELLASGQVQLGPLLGKTYALDEINKAVEDLESGRAVRPLIEMGPR